jgi:hypothetical protein
MRVTLLFCTFLLVLSCQKNIDIEPINYLSETEQFDFKYELVRYFEGLPKKATHQTKFDSIFDDYYKSKAEQSNLLYYFKDDSNGVYFAIAKIAPSVSVKKVTTIGKVSFDTNNEIVYYEEICRTWKMPEEELTEKSRLIFLDVINDKDISKYYTKNSQPELFIEFPDDFTYFESKERTWKVRK